MHLPKTGQLGSLFFGYHTKYEFDFGFSLRLLIEVEPSFCNFGRSNDTLQ